MNPRRVVGVRELRQNLSVYLDRVKRGETLTVTEHRQVVALLQPPTVVDPLRALVAAGIATAPGRALSELPAPVRAGLDRPLSQVLRELNEDTI